MRGTEIITPHPKPLRSKPRPQSTDMTRGTEEEEDLEEEAEDVVKGLISVIPSTSLIMNQDI